MQYYESPTIYRARPGILKAQAQAQAQLFPFRRMGGELEGALLACWK